MYYYHKIAKLLFVFIIMALSSVVFASGSDILPSRTGPEIVSLENCLDTAFKNSKDLKASAQNITIAKEQLRQAEGGIWPILGYEIAASDSDRNQIEWMSAFYGVESKKISSTSINLTQPLYTGGKLTHGIQLAKLNLEAAMEDDEKARQALIFTVKSAFYRVWLAQQMVKVAESSYDNMGRHARQVESFYQVGKASRFDWLRAQVEKENLKPTLIKAQNEVVLAKLNLATVIGLEKSQRFMVNLDVSKLKLPDQVKLESGSLLEQAYQNRPELKRFRKLTAMAKLQTDMAYAGYKPSVALIGSYQGRSLGKYDPGAWDDNTQWILKLDVKGNFFDGLITPAKVGEMKANQKVVEINEFKLRDRIYQDVEQAIQEVKEGLEIVHASQGNMNLAEESLNITQVKFESGTATTMDVRDSQLALDQALNGYYEGISAYLTACAKLDLAMGTNNGTTLITN